MLDISGIMVYHIEVGKRAANTEQYRSGHNGHDWKSCVPQKGTEGSNPSCSARINPVFLTEYRIFFLLIVLKVEKLPILIMPITDIFHPQIQLC